MHRINPDMDDLFKSAADEYPLKTDTADWNNVTRKLQADLNKKVNKNRASRNRKMVSILALLMIPICLTVSNYSFNYYHETEMKISDVKQDWFYQKNILSADANERKLKLIPENTRTGKITDVNFLPVVAEHERNIEEIKNLPNQNAQNFDLKINHALSANVFGKAEASEKTESQNIDTHSNEKSNHFYIGMSAAPELTSVKFQPARKSFNAGLLVGYTFNNKLNIEMGVMFAKKYYYSNGKYIAPNSIRNDNSTILAVNANCSITEMPLTLQYNFKNVNDTRIFAGAGAVSYVLHKEQYNYIFTKNGEEMPGRKYNNKASDNWFANAQLSIGYEHSFADVCNVSVEPYYRIPLKGIGISELPVSEVGVNIAITKTIK
jgi:Outer membrane protein beta-barrel domain